MAGFVVSAEAESDLEAIGDFIYLDNPGRSVTFILEMTEYFRTIAERPLSFPNRNELAPKLRSAVYGRYLILFEMGESEVRIVRIVHGARDLSSLF